MLKSKKYFKKIQLKLLQKKRTSLTSTFYINKVCILEGILSKSTR